MSSNLTSSNNNLSAGVSHWVDQIAWGADGLVPVIAQEIGSKDILMFAWMNPEALQKTAELGRAVYFSRSRQKLWFKGEESGHIQRDAHDRIGIAQTGKKCNLGIDHGRIRSRQRMVGTGSAQSARPRRQDAFCRSQLWRSDREPAGS